MAGVAELLDRAAALPPGPELSAALGALPWKKVPNARLVDVLQARSRQLAHDQAELLAGMVEVSHAVAVEDLPADLPGGRGAAVARVEKQFEWASHEIAAGLTLTPTAADRELGFAAAVCERLPLVFAALQRGEIDRGKARVFVEYLDPANGEVTEAQAARLCERFVPVAPGLTTKQLSDRLYRALLAIDPTLRRRRYERHLVFQDAVLSIGGAEQPPTAPCPPCESRAVVPYVITEACIDETDKSCVEECPVDCIYEGDRMLYIQPDECVECGRCEPVCPQVSIFHHEDLPDGAKQWEQVNSEFFASLGSPGGARKIGPTGVDHPAVAQARPA